MSDDVTVAVQDLSKTYYLGARGSERSLFGRRGRTEVRALKNASFVAHTGEAIGILGHNGSGKSTLLRLMAGTESPTSGQVLVSAQPTLLGVSAALQPHLTGRANVQLGLLAMGLTLPEVESLEASVIDWADLTAAADRPLRTYSSGMTARLKFAISTSIRRELLLVDEALSTGDATFTEKAETRMNEFLVASGTVFIVSHVASTIRKYCSRVIWLNEGEIIADGTPGEIFAPYLKWTKFQAAGKFTEASEVIKIARNDYIPYRVLFDSDVIKAFDNA